MSDDPRCYWLWLQHALGAGSSKPARILETYPGVREFYKAGRQSWLMEGYFSQKELYRLSSWSVSEAAAALEFAVKTGETVLTPDDEGYPELLRQIPAYPCALYVKGKIPDLESHPPIAIVGTRRATATGRTAARSIAFGLAKEGSAVISGGALGIATAAHKGALQAGGKTVCVLGCGIGADYLMVNASLREVIAQNGALVSEYPPDTQAMSSNFPIRNRIISGLSVGTLVVEAACRSGSLITSNYAADQGRDVFAVPADILNPVSAGVNKLIKDGAKPVCRAEDILEEYSGRYAEKIKLDGGAPDDMIKVNDAPAPEPADENDGGAEELSEDARAVRGALSRSPEHISHIAEKTGLPSARLLSALTELELCGFVQTFSGGRYSLPRR